MPNDPRTDAIRRHLLVLRCQAGDDSAFAMLYAEFGSRSLRYLVALIGDEEAEDVQQEVWLSVYTRIGSLADPGRFTTWLLTTARNRAIDWLRRRRRDRTMFQEESAAVIEAPAPAPDREAPGFDNENVKAAMSRLSAIHREVLMLRYRDELSYAEIALVTSSHIGTVRSRLHHARLELEKLLGPEPATATGITPGGPHEDA